MFNIKNLNDTATIREHILKRQLNSVNNRPAVSRLVYMPVMDNSFKTTSMKLRPKTDFSIKAKNNKTEQSTTPATATRTTNYSNESGSSNSSKSLLPKKFNSNKIVFSDIKKNDTTKSNLKLSFNNRTSTPINDNETKQKIPRSLSKEFDLAINNNRHKSPSGIANKNFIDLIQILGVNNNRNKSSSLNQRNKTALK